MNFSLLMLTLQDKEAIKKATDTLKGLQAPIKALIDKTDFQLQVKGVGHFTMGRGGQSKVLYADVQKDDNYTLLESITDLVIKMFIEEKIVDEKDLGTVKYDHKSKQYKLTYHLTLINTKYEKIDGRIIGFEGKGRAFRISHM